MDSRVVGTPPGARASLRLRMRWVCALHLAIIAAISLLGVYQLVPALVVMVVVILATLLAWLVVRHEWRSVRRLAQLVEHWNGDPPYLTSLRLDRLSVMTNADVAALAHGLHGFATRIADYTQRERNFTRDASHELRSPLTVIKMSVDMLGDEQGLSDFGTRSVRRIRRAGLEMEALVEALLVLAREPDALGANERFTVNDVVRRQLDSARELVAGCPIELRFEESTRFALNGSARGFAVLCWQLIRNACQQTDEGQVLVRVTPGMVSVSSIANVATPNATASYHASNVSRHGFELAIAQRISNRFAWPLELQALDDRSNVARIHFHDPLPPDTVPRHLARL